MACPLTPGTRPHQVLALTCDGLTAKEIGQQLGISPRTVEIHRTRAFAAVGARTVAQAVNAVRLREIAALQAERDDLKSRLAACLARRF